MHKDGIQHIHALLGAALASEDRIAVCPPVNHEVFGDRDRSGKITATVYCVLTPCHPHIGLRRSE